MLDDLPCKFQCLPFFFCRSTVSYDLAVFSCFSAVVRCLYEKSAGNLVQLEFFFFGRWYFDQTDISLRAEDVESFLGEFWSHDDFEENRLHSFSGFLVAFTVHGNDAAESRFAVSVEGSLECFKSCASKSGAAWVRVLDDDACRLVFPFAGKIPCCFHINDIVVGKFLAVELLGSSDAACCFRILVECSFLMRVFAVAQVLQLDISHAVNIRQCIVIPINLFCQIVSDSAVVKACVEECLSGEVQTEFISQLVIFNSFKNVIILLGIDDNSNVLVVLCCCTDHGRAADIDIFDSFSSGDIRLCNGFPERVQVDGYEVDACNAVFLHGLDMFRVVTDSKDAAVDHRMQCLDSAIHHFRETGNFRNRFYRNACICDCLHGSACGNDFHAEFMKSSCEIYNTCLIRYADKRSFDCHYNSSFVNGPFPGDTM